MIVEPPVEASDCQPAPGAGDPDRGEATGGWGQCGGKALALAAALFLACRAPPPTEEPRERIIARAQQLAADTRFDEARSLLEAALERSQAEGERYWEGRLLATLGDVVGFAGDAEAAVDLHRRAMAAFEEVGERRSLADLHLQIAAFSGGWEGFDQAERLYRELGLPVEVAKIDSRRSVRASQDGRAADAVRFAERALPILEAAGRRGELLAALSGLAYGLQELGQLDRALAIYGRVIELAWERNEQRVVQFAYCNRAEVLRRQGQVAPAEADLRQAIAGFERARAHIVGSPELRAAYLERQVRAYDRLVLLLADSYRGIEAFDVVERFHARSFLELLDEAHLAAAGPRDPELAKEEQRVTAELGSARLALDAGEGSAPDLRSRLAELEAELSELRAATRRRDPRYAELVAPEPPVLAEAQGALGDGEALVAYWLTDDRILAWTLTADEAHFSQAPVARSELEQTVGRYLEPLRFAGRAEDAALTGREDRHLAAGQRLYRWLIGSLPTVARRASTLIVVRDDFLHYLPFEALPSRCSGSDRWTAEDTLHSSYRGCSFLGLERAIAYVPSAGVLVSLRRRHASRAPHASRAGEAAGDLLAMARTHREVRRAGQPVVAPAPLARAAEEVETVAGLFRRPTVLLDDGATESAFKELAGRHRVVHVATHGRMRDDLPMSSGLSLGAGAGEDGLLQAHEVLGLDLRAELVALSACRSGRGRLRRGEGLVGLSQAFLYAGAGAVLVSLWDVDDRATGLLMAAFYRHLRRGVGAAEALRRARSSVFARDRPHRLVFRERPLALAHPRFWAAFVLVGRPKGGGPPAEVRGAFEGQ